MEQLSGLDASFLEMEKGNTYNHVAMMAIYDPSTSPTGKVRFKDILNHFKSRLDINKLFSRRLVTLPYGLDRPYWSEDSDIDVEFHIRHIALPQPGDWRQLMIQVARLHSRPLDRSRPMWEMYVIEGLDNIPDLPHGSFAMFFKFHHAAIDGAAGAELIKTLHAATADLDKIDPQPEKKPNKAASKDSNPLEIFSLAAVNGLGRLFGMSSFYANTAMKVTGMALKAVTERTKSPDGPANLNKLTAITERNPAPQTRFNKAISANRAVDAVALPFAAIKKIRAGAPGASMNDIFLAVAGGALRKYLASKDELPAETLRALMPINVRATGPDAAAGNNISATPVPLHTEIADPLKRLRAVHEGTESGKAVAELIGADTIKTIYDQFPFFVSNFVLQNLVINQVNCTVSNVRGPEGPLFVAGARLVHAYPVSIPQDGIGLNLTGFSYNGVLWICAVACRNMMPDPAFFAECLRDSFAELATAVQALTQSDVTAAVPRLPKVEEKPVLNTVKDPEAKKPARAGAAAPTTARKAASAKPAATVKAKS